MDINHVYGDIFRACTIKSISYRVYARKQDAPSTPHDELLGSGALQKAEVTLRKECTNVMVSRSSSKNELWVYCCEEEGSNPAPRGVDLFPNDVLDKFEVETVAQGVFLPPFTGGVTPNNSLSRSVSTNSLAKLAIAPRPDEETHSRYGPLVRAIELRFLDALLRTGDLDQYEAFSTKAALSTGDGAIIKVVPILHQDGSLAVRITSQHARLVPLPVNSLQMCAAVVWLLPMGKPCRILTSLRYEDVFEPPSISRARALYHILTSYTVTNVTLEQLESSMWIRVRGIDTGEEDLLWPVALIRATHLTSSGYDLATEASVGHIVDTPASSDSLKRGTFGLATSRVRSGGGGGGGGGVSNSSSGSGSGTGSAGAGGFLHSQFPFASHSPTNFSYRDTVPNASSRRPLAKLLKPSPYVALSEAMLHVRHEINHEREETKLAEGAGVDPETAVANLRHSLIRPIAPPPSPRSATAAPSLAPSVAPTAAPTAAPTPTAMTPAAGTPAHITHVYPTPTYQTPTTFQTPSYATPMTATPAMPADAWMDVEEEQEVGDADFNFFDLPINGQARRDTSEIKLEEAPALPTIGMEYSHGDDKATKMQDVEAAVKNEEDVPYHANEAGVKIQNFASIDLHSSNLDSKYASGGRFYVPPPQPDSSSDSDENDGHPQPPKLRKQRRREQQHQQQPPRVRDEDMSYSSGSESADEDEMVAEEYRDDDEYNHPFLFKDATPAPDKEEIKKMWIKFMQNEEVKVLPIDESKFVSFKQLLPQLVFDAGMLSEIYESTVVSGQTSVAPEYICKRLPWNVQQCPLGETLSKNTSSMVPSKSSTPSSLPPMPSSSSSTTTGTTPTSSASQQQQQQKKMQLLSPPLVAVRRGKYKLRARVSILRFWRLLGLAPPPSPGDTDEHGAEHQQFTHLSLPDLESEPPNKKLVVVLMTLASPAVVDGARRVLNGLKTAYESCSLGEIELPTFGSVDQGLMAISADLGHISGDAIGDLFQMACAQLKTQLQAQSEYGPETKLLVFTSYPPSSLRGGTLTAKVPFQLAQGFTTIQGAYPESRWLLSSLDALVSRWDHDKLINEYEMEKLALLIYGRFPQFPQAFWLAGLVPHSSGLQFSVEMPQFLMEDEPVLHVAYSIVAGRWCLTSWSDQWARKKDIDLLRLSDTSERSMQLVFGDLLRRSEIFARSIKDRPGWRFNITKCGAMTAAEAAIWARVIKPDNPVVLMDIPHSRGLLVADHRSARPARPPSPATTQSSIQPSPSPQPPLPLLQLPSQPSSARSSVTTTGGDTGTPKNKGQILSPHPAGGSEGTLHSSPSTMPTASPQTSSSVSSPKPGTKSDGVIVDASDEIYGISVEAPKAGLSRYAEAIAQGYILRPSVEGHVALEARLLQVFNLPIAPRILMSRVIGQLRRLASLSEFMGVTTESTLIPWHIMALAKLEAAAMRLNML